MFFFIFFSTMVYYRIFSMVPVLYNRTLFTQSHSIFKLEIRICMVSLEYLLPEEMNRCPLNFREQCSMGINACIQTAWVQVPALLLDLGQTIKPDGDLFASWSDGSSDSICVAELLKRLSRYDLQAVSGVLALLSPLPAACFLLGRSLHLWGRASNICILLCAATSCSILLSSPYFSVFGAPWQPQQAPIQHVSPTGEIASGFVH